jgi:hypothetical protein
MTTCVCVAGIGANYLREHEMEILSVLGTILTTIGVFFVWLADKLPEDKILAWAASDDAKLILSAMKKVAESAEGIQRRDRRGDRVIAAFVDPFVEYAGYVDRNVVKHARRRYERNASRLTKLTQARTAAGEILMGGSDEKGNGR